MGADQPPGLDPEIAALRDGAAEQPRLVHMSPEEARARVSAGDRLCAGGPDVDVVDQRPHDSLSVPVRIYTPSQPLGTLVYAHGGGWVTGDLEYSDQVCRHLAAGARLRVVSVDYRLAPEHPFPAALEDVAAAWGWASTSHPGWCGLGGDSAGGNLTAALAVRLSAAGHPPSALILVYPVLGVPGGTDSYTSRAEAFPTGAADMAWFWEHYTGGRLAGHTVPDLAPLATPDVTSHPPTHVVAAGHDPLHDEALQYVQRLRDSGVAVSVAEHSTLSHGFLRFTGVCSAARTALADLVAVVTQMAGPVRGPRTDAPNHAYDSALNGGPSPAQHHSREIP